MSDLYRYMIKSNGGVPYSTLDLLVISLVEGDAYIERRLVKGEEVYGLVIGSSDGDVELTKEQALALCLKGIKIKDKTKYYDIKYKGWLGNREIEDEEYDLYLAEPTEACAMAVITKILKEQYRNIIRYGVELTVTKVEIMEVYER